MVVILTMLHEAWSFAMDDKDKPCGQADLPDEPEPGGGGRTRAVMLKHRMSFIMTKVKRFTLKTDD